MSPGNTAAATAASDDPSARNEVVLRGRVAAPAEERELPSGDTIMTARLIVDRDDAALGRSTQRVDTIDCVAWLRRVQRSMRGWEQGERVEVTGSIRRRFFRGAAGPASRVEVEIRSVTRLDRPGRKPQAKPRRQSSA
jgi:single-strand DNA-binding protein